MNHSLYIATRKISARTLASSSLLILLSLNTEAALHDRGAGLIYDDVLDVTWLTDTDYASSTLTASGVNDIISNNTLVFNDGHELTNTDFFIVQSNGAGDAGLMKWWGAMAWTDQLEYFDSARGVTYTDWRLPTVSPVNGGTFDTVFSNNGTTDNGYGSVGFNSEFRHMFYNNLGNLGICLPDGSGSSATCETQDGWGLNNRGSFVNLQTQTYWSNTELGAEVWAFDFGVGFQGLKTESNRNNQLHAWAVRDGDVAAVVPVPASMWLFISGLVGIFNFSRRNSQNESSK